MAGLQQSHQEGERHHADKRGTQALHISHCGNANVQQRTKTRNCIESKIIQVSKYKNFQWCVCDFHKGTQTLTLGPTCLTMSQIEYDRAADYVDTVSACIYIYNYFIESWCLVFCIISAIGTCTCKYSTHCTITLWLRIVFACSLHTYDKPQAYCTCMYSVHAFPALSAYT